MSAKLSWPYWIQHKLYTGYIYIKIALVVYLYNFNFRRCSVERGENQGSLNAFHAAVILAVIVLISTSGIKEKNKEKVKVRQGMK